MTSPRSRRTFWESNEFLKVTQKMRLGYSIFDSHRLMFRELIKLISAFSDGLTRWCDHWGRNLSSSLDDGTSVTTGMTFLVDAARAMAASHAGVVAQLSSQVVDPLTEFPKVNYRKNWFGRLKDAIEFEDECDVAQAPLIHAIKKMERAKRRYQDVGAKMTREQQQQRGGGRETAKMAKLREEVKMAKTAYDNSFVAVTFCRRQCRVTMGNAYDKTEVLERRRLRFLESIVLAARSAFLVYVDGDSCRTVWDALTNVDIAVNVAADLARQRRKWGDVDAPLDLPVFLSAAASPDAEPGNRNARALRSALSIARATEVFVPLDRSAGLITRLATPKKQPAVVENRAGDASPATRPTEEEDAANDDDDDDDDDDKSHVIDDVGKSHEDDNGDNHLESDDADSDDDINDDVDNGDNEDDKNGVDANGVVDNGVVDNGVVIDVTSPGLSDHDYGEYPTVFSDAPPDHDGFIPSLYLRAQTPRLDSSDDYGTPAETPVGCRVDAPTKTTATPQPGVERTTRTTMAPTMGASLVMQKRLGASLMTSTPNTCIDPTTTTTPNFVSAEFYPIPNSRFVVRKVSTPRAVSRRRKQGGIRFSFGSSVSPSPDSPFVTHL